MKNFDELKVSLFNSMVKELEKRDTLCKEDRKWFAIGYLQSFIDNEILDLQGRYNFYMDEDIRNLKIYFINKLYEDEVL